VTTRSPEALRAFLEGERLYRLGELREARRVLEEAVRVDSTFALAHYRLGWARAWTEGLNAATTVAQLLSASEFSDRLPEREQRLVEGFLMLVEDRLEEGLALLEPYVRRWPDDPEAWFLVANYQWHHPEWMGRTTAQVLEPFDRVIALDSTLTIAYRHPLQLALHNRDKELYDRYMQPLRRFVADLESNSGWRTYLRQAAACFEGAPDVDPLPLAARLSGEPNHPPPCAADR
jgi:tetratricopeptide (TPR) repeat protein